MTEQLRDDSMMGLVKAKIVEYLRTQAAPAPLPAVELHLKNAGVPADTFDVRDAVTALVREGAAEYTQYREVRLGGTTGPTHAHSIICGTCYPEAKVVRRLSESLELVEYPEGCYLLVTQNGHLPEDALVAFLKPPYPDPDPECDAGDPEASRRAEQFVDDVEGLEPLLRYSPGRGHFFYREAVGLGYTTPRDAYGAKLFHYWLFHTMGVHVRAYEAGGKAATQPTT